MRCLRGLLAHSEEVVGLAPRLVQALCVAQPESIALCCLETELDGREVTAG